MYICCMDNLDFLFDDSHTEKDMVDNISNVVTEINDLTDKVSNNLKHFYLQLVCLIICYVFNVFSTATIFFIIASICSFLLAGGNFQKRKDMYAHFGFLIMEYKRKKILTNENKNFIKELKIKKLWFEK